MLEQDMPSHELSKSLHSLYSRASTVGLQFALHDWGNSRRPSALQYQVDTHALQKLSAGPKLAVQQQRLGQLLVHLKRMQGNKFSSDVRPNQAWRPGQNPTKPWTWASNVKSLITLASSEHSVVPA